MAIIRKKKSEYVKTYIGGLVGGGWWLLVDKRKREKSKKRDRIQNVREIPNIHKSFK